MAFDALGNEVLIGERYGYSSRSNGIVNVVIGVATKINEETSNISLQVERKLSGVYNNPLADDKHQKRNSVSVLSNTIFPLRNEVVQWPVTQN